MFHQLLVILAAFLYFVNGGMAQSHWNGWPSVENLFVLYITIHPPFPSIIYF